MTSTAPASRALQPRELPFRKMHGIGNDFVVLDVRGRALDLPQATAKTLADRRWGVGCDEILIIENPRNGGDAFMGVRNADGTVAEQCGNGVRCVADLLMNELGKTKLVIETLGGDVIATRAKNGLISIDMGPAKLDWREIPLSQERDTLHLGISEGALSDPVGVSMGNPHAVFFVPNAEAVDLANVGPKLEHHSLFPERANIEVIQVLSRTHLRMRVWERGSGITQACGTGACASAVAAIRRGLTERAMTITLDGGDLHIEWRDDGHVIMTGPVAYVFDGTWTIPS
ncbi:MAG: diaminopimelate epimerase [Rhodospirillaceae bacterium]|nr:diaminopimelate epimerase [Rhodospirillaceae bacterium]